LGYYSYYIYLNWGLTGARMNILSINMTSLNDENQRVVTVFGPIGSFKPLVDWKIHKLKMDEMKLSTTYEGVDYIIELIPGP
jgi:hypothetical protein